MPITHQHLHDHLVAIGKDQEAQTSLLRKIQQEQEAQSLILRRMFKKVGELMATAADLTREIAETRTALGALLAKMQELIDTIAGSPDNQAAIDAAVAELDDLQTEMAAVVNPTPTP